MELQQYDFAKTALPRWGCFWLSIGAGVGNYIREEPTYPVVADLYEKSLKASCRVYEADGTDRDGYVLEIDDQGHLNCTRPGIALRMWIKALGAKGDGDQVGDEGGFFPNVSDEMWRETFRLRRYVTDN